MDVATTEQPGAASAREPEHGFRALFDTRFDQLKRLAYLFGADDPEDVAQEAIVRLHAKWSRLDDPAKALAYLRATVANLSRSRLRHLRVVRRTPEERDRDTASAESQVLGAAVHGRLWSALGTLTARQRQVVVLRFWLDLQITDVAQTLGISPGTVKATLSQAMDKLRKALPAEEEW